MTQRTIEKCSLLGIGSLRQLYRQIKGHRPERLVNSIAPDGNTLASDYLLQVAKRNRAKKLCPIIEGQKLVQHIIPNPKVIFYYLFTIPFRLPKEKRNFSTWQ